MRPGRLISGCGGARNARRRPAAGVGLVGRVNPPAGQRLSQSRVEGLHEVGELSLVKTVEHASGFDELGLMLPGSARGNAGPSGSMRTATVGRCRRRVSFPARLSIRSRQSATRAAASRAEASLGVEHLSRLPGPRAAEIAADSRAGEPPNWSRSSIGSSSRSTLKIPSRCASSAAATATLTSTSVTASASP